MLDANLIAQIESVVGYKFKDKNWLNKAITHKSYSDEKGLDYDNEKLEFLGDSVLDLCLSEILMEKFPKDDEGDLSKKRASLVNQFALSEFAKRLELSQFILLGKGEIQGGGAFKNRILASAYEALIGSIFKDGGFAASLELIRRHFEKRIDETQVWSSDFKTVLQELSQSLKLGIPDYVVKSEEGPDHSKTYEIVVHIENKPVAEGVGSSKKKAEQEAARKAIDVIKR